jgi:hypothetical protein
VTALILLGLCTGVIVGAFYVLMLRIKVEDD